MFVTGIDIGGTHITAGMVCAETGAIHDSRVVRRYVNCHAPADMILAAWCAAIQELWAAHSLAQAPLAFAMPGPFDYANGICLMKGYGKYEDLYGMDIRETLAHRLGLHPGDIRFRNDAEAFLEGEVRAGAARDAVHAIGMTLGTGMGTAKSHDGVTEDAELSFRVQVNGVSVEEEISARGLLRTYTRCSGHSVKDVQTLAGMQEQDAAARETFRIFAVHLSNLLTLFIREEKPEVVVMGGNIAEAWDLFMPDVLVELSRELQGTLFPQIVKATLGERAALIGAAALFFR